MKIRGDISAVIEGLHRDQGLLAAFLEATDKVDWRPVHKREAIAETATPINLEASLEVFEASLEVLPVSEAPKGPAAPFAFRRANLVRASE